jgi:WD40 repeat protein
MALLMTLLAAGGGAAAAAPAAADPGQLARSRQFAGAAHDLLQRPAVHGEKTEAVALYAAEAVHLARGDAGQLGAVLPVLREALGHLAGTALRIHARLEEEGDPEEISSIAMSGDGSLIVCGTTGGLVYVWRVGRDGVARQEKLLVTAAIASPQLAHELVGQVQLLFQDRWLVPITASGRMRALDTTKAFSELEIPAEWQPNAGLTVSPDGALVGVVRPDGSAIDIWQLKDGRPFKVWSYSDPALPIQAISFSADGKILLVTHDASEVRVLESATGKVSRALSLPAPDVAVPASSMGVFSVNLGPPTDRAEISPNALALIMQETYLVQHVATQPDGSKEVVEAPSVEMGAWNLSGARPASLPGCIAEMTGSPPTQLRFSRNSWLAAAYGRRLMLLDLSSLRANGRQRCYRLERETGPYLTSVSFDRGGRVAVGTTEGDVEVRKLGDTESMAHALIVPGFPGAVPEIAHEGQRMLLHSGLDQRHGQLIRSCDLDKDCQPRDAAAGGGADALLALARRLIARNLTVAEWRAVLPTVPYERTFEDIGDMPLIRSLVEQASHEAAAGHQSEASGVMRRALDAASASGSPYALAGISRAALDLQMFDLAAAAADALLQMLPADPAALWYRGQARALMGDKAAIADLQAYIDWQRSHKATPASLQWERNAIGLLRSGDTPVPR